MLQAVVSGNAKPKAEKRRDTFEKKKVGHGGRTVGS